MVVEPATLARELRTFLTLHDFEPPRYLFHDVPGVLDGGALLGQRKTHECGPAGVLLDRAARTVARVHPRQRIALHHRPLRRPLRRSLRHARLRDDRPRVRPGEGFDGLLDRRFPGLRRHPRDLVAQLRIAPLELRDRRVDPVLELPVRRAPVVDAVRQLLRELPAVPPMPAPEHPPCDRSADEERNDRVDRDLDEVRGHAGSGSPTEAGSLRRIESFVGRPPPRSKARLTGFRVEASSEPFPCRELRLDRAEEGLPSRGDRRHSTSARLSGLARLRPRRLHTQARQSSCVADAAAPMFPTRRLPSSTPTTPSPATTP